MATIQNAATMNARSKRFNGWKVRRLTLIAAADGTTLPTNDPSIRDVFWETLSGASDLTPEITAQATGDVTVHAGAASTGSLWLFSGAGQKDTTVHADSAAGTALATFLADDYGTVFHGNVINRSPRMSYHGLRWRELDVTDVDDADTVATGIPGITRVMWRGDADDDTMAVTITDVATGTLTFNTNGAGGHEGRVLCGSRG